MNKQRMNNILSSVQMNPRDRKDFIDELSKLGAGGQGGGEVSSEHPVRIIELTMEDLNVGNKEVNLTIEEYEKTDVILNLNDGTNIYPFKRIRKSFAYPNKYPIDIYSTVFEAGGPGNSILEIRYLNILMQEDNKLDFSALSIDINNFPACIFNSKQKENNIFLCSEIAVNTSISAALIYDNRSIILGNYYNGTITAFVEGKIKQYNVNQDTGEITESLSIDISTLAGLEARIAALENA